MLDSIWKVAAAAGVTVLVLAAGVPAATAVTNLEGSQATTDEDGRVVLDHGHADIFNVSAENGGLKLQLKEDITGHEVMRKPESVSLVVKDTAWTPGLANIKQIGFDGYLLPMTQNMNLLWPGWDTLQVAPGGFEAVDINFMKVSGPGRVVLASQDFTGQPTPLLKNDKYLVEDGAVREQSFPAHTHANWIFEKPGIYTMVVNATAMKGGTKFTSNTATYTWKVAPQKITETAPAKTTEAPTPGNTPTPGDGSVGTGETPHSGDTTPGKGSAQSGAGSDEPQGGQVTRPNKQIPTNPADGREAGSASANVKQNAAKPSPRCYLRETKGEQVMTAALKDDRTSPAVMRDPRSVPFLLGANSQTTTTAAVGNIPAGKKVWMIGATQAHGIPWLGANTMNESLLANTTGSVTWTLSSFSGPGNMEVFTSGNFGQIVGQKWFAATPGHPQGSYTLDRNTHVHPNWVFDAPGTYRVGITQSVKSKSGRTLHSKTTLTFHVGSGTGVTDGHFDLGSEVTQGTGKQWMTADGQPCHIGEDGKPVAGPSRAGGSGSLANTGADSLTVPLAVFAAGIGVLGAGLVANRRRS